MIGSTLLLIRSLIQNGAIPKPATQAMRQITATRSVQVVVCRVSDVRDSKLYHKEFYLLHAGYTLR